MILTKEQINRYLRHIIMPEISGPGQKKLLDASVVIQSESAEACAPLLYYLVAAGIGHISCVFLEEQGYEILFSNLRDLNSDISITFNRIPEKISSNGINLRIILGNAEYVADSLPNTVDDSWIPIIIAMNRGWEGYIQVFKQREQMESVVLALQTAIQQCNAHFNSNDEDGTGRVFSTCLLGALTTIEGIKLILNIGTSVENPFSFNLLSMSFDNQENNDPTSANFFTFKADTTDCDNYSANGTGCIPKSPKRLCDYKALIVGTGGLGSPVAYALTKAGIGTIGLVDHDTVDISNLNRQILHSGSRLGLPKVESAEIFLRRLNPEVTIVKHHTNFNEDNAFEIMTGYDVIIDGVDNFPTRYLLNDACFLMKKPMIEAGVAGFDGMGTTIIPDETMCYRCLFPTIPAPGSVPSCSETGILGPVAGVMGFIEACEAAKLLIARGTTLKDSLLAFDALDLKFDLFKAEKNATCPLCGINPSIRELKGYKFRCETQKDDELS